MKRTSKILWGLVLIAAAALIIISSMGYLHGISFGQIFFSAIWGALIISGLFNQSFSSIIFGAAFLGIVWDKELGIEQITPWPILGAALLLTIGISLIFGGKKKSKHWESKYIPHDKSYDSGERIYWKTKFGGSEKYIDSPNLVSVDLETKFGGTEVYMDKAIAAGNTVVVRVNCLCGGIELYIPRNWRVTNQVNCVLGAVDGPNDINEVNYVNMILTGNVKLGGIDINRV